MIQRQRRRNKVTVSTKTPKTHAVPNGRSATSMSAATVVSKYQTFPQGDCAADFPPDDIVYEVSVQELKQLRRKIDDLPYPIVVQLGNIFNNPGRQWTGTEATMRSRAAGASKIEMLGGVPVDRALDPKVRDLLAPAFVDVAVSNVDVLSRTPGAANVRVAGKSLRVALNATAREELAAGRPAMVSSLSRSGPALVRLVPEVAANSAGAAAPQYVVENLAGFLARPRIAAVGGVEQPVKLNQSQVADLLSKGATSINLNGGAVTIRSAAPTASMSSAMVRAGGSDAVASGTIDRSQPMVAIESTPESSLELALYLSWKQKWHLLGYTRGQLLNALTLAPQEETVIEVSSWDRRKRTTEDSVSTAVEQTTEFTDTTKDVFGILNELKNDNQFNVDTQFSAGVRIPADTVDIGLSSTVGAGFKNAVAQSSKTSLDHMRESMMKAGTKLRIERQTKVGESVEIGREEKVTRRVRNSNMCYALTLNYFETLAHYDITTELDLPAARLCILVDSPWGPSFSFTKQNIRFYEGVLRRVLLEAELAPGFSAAHRLVAVDELGAAHILLKAESPDKQGDQSSGPVAAALADANQTFSSVLANFQSVKDSAVATDPAGGDLLFLVRIQATPETDRRRTFYRRRLKELAPGLFTTLDQMLGKTPDEPKLQNLSRSLSDITTVDQIGRDRMNQPGAEEHRIYEIAREEFQVPWSTIWDPGASFLHVDDAGLVGALKNFQSSYDKLIQARSMQAASSTAEKATPEVSPSYSAKEVAEALEQLDALLSHLNAYGTYYRGALLRLMPLDDNLMNKISQFSNLVERRVLGEFNGKIALPLRAELDPRTQDLFNALVAENARLTGLTDGFEIALPTPGLHIEPRLGQCNACEDYVQSLRTLDISTKTADLDLKRQQLEQEKLETDRYAQRLKAHELSDPENKPGLLQVAVEGGLVTRSDGAGVPKPPAP